MSMSVALPPDGGSPPGVAALVEDRGGWAFERPLERREFVAIAGAAGVLAAAAGMAWRRGRLSGPGGVGSPRGEVVAPSVPASARMGGQPVDLLARVRARGGGLR